jgi:hypothetical protein
MTAQTRNYDRAIAEIDEHVLQTKDLLYDAQDAMNQHRPNDALKHFNDAKAHLEGMMVTAKWAQTLLPEEEK